MYALGVCIGCARPRQNLSTCSTQVQNPTWTHSATFKINLKCDGMDVLRNSYVETLREFPLLYVCRPASAWSQDFCGPRGATHFFPPFSSAVTMTMRWTDGWTMVKKLKVDDDVDDDDEGLHRRHLVRRHCII